MKILMDKQELIQQVEEAIKYCMKNKLVTDEELARIKAEPGYSKRLAIECLKIRMPYHKKGLLVRLSNGHLGLKKPAQ